MIKTLVDFLAKSCVNLQHSRRTGSPMKLLLRIFVPFFITIPLSAQMNTAQELFNQYDRFKLHEITTRRFTQAQMLGWLQLLETKKAFVSNTVGSSAEGRVILLLKSGNGPTKVLLWTQMHGDESTATMALLDILNFFAQEPNHPLVKSLRDNLTLLMIPMLNPDGAERFQRRTAQMIDLNRDALRLGTPEAAVLKTVRDSYEPDFGFNLHDQDPRYTVGQAKNPAAIALLAPAYDESRNDNPVRTRAKMVAARIAATLGTLIPGLIARYDDTFEPRAFGDNIQKWGTSTILVESGGWRNDPEKMHLRKLNFVALLDALLSIATNEYASVDVALYDQLPFNGKNLFDMILRNAELSAHSTAKPLTVDIGINFSEERDSAGQREIIGTIMDVGDLSTFGSFEEYDCQGVTLDSTQIDIEKKMRRDDILRLIGKL